MSRSEMEVLQSCVGVLLVEKESSVIEAVRHSLIEIKECRLYVARGREEALERLDGAGPGLVLCVHDSFGPEFITMIGRWKPSVYCIASLPSGQKSLAAAYQEAGAVECIYVECIYKDVNYTANFIGAVKRALIRILEDKLSRAQLSISNKESSDRSSTLRAFQPGDTVLHYRIVDTIGEGAMAEIYKAEDLKLGRVVALKVIRLSVAEHEPARKRLVREARLLSSLSHPNIVTVYAVEESEGLHFIVMEYVEGETLASRIGQGRMKSAEILSIAIGVAEALEEAHSKDVIHRDLKPANILITAQGQVKVVDFGFAKLTQTATEERIRKLKIWTTSVAGAVLGTVPYMGPEQLLGKKLDGRSDLFSFGAVLYEMSTGRPPFSNKNPAKLIELILDRQPEPVARFNPEAPAELNRIIRKCLEKDPERRYRSAHDLLSDLRNFQGNATPFPTTVLQLLLLTAALVVSFALFLAVVYLL